MATTRKKRTTPSTKDAQEKFERDLRIRGEAAPLDDSGKLPLDATHEIVQEKKDGKTTTKIQRRRFKLF
jgi:hypothetical protein